MYETCHLHYIYTYMRRAFTCQYVHDGAKPPLFKRGDIFARIARICTYIRASTYIYVHIRAKI